MRIVHAALLLVVSAGPAFAQRVPAIVIPGRLDVPVMMNGVDISFAVIDGDFGLDRPRGVTPTVIYRPYAVALPDAGIAPRPHYFPSSNQMPGYGRLEVDPGPNRPLPPPAQSYRKSWSSQSGSGPVTEYPNVPMPPVIWNGGWSNGNPRPPRPPHGGVGGGVGPAPHGPGR